VCGLKPGDFRYFLGDAHVYKNHLVGVAEQLTRSPKPFPKLQVNNTKTDIDDFVFEDFVLSGYEAHPAIAFKMAV
jgi:thymidylate synthase